MRILALTNLYPSPQQPHRATYNRQIFRALAADHEVRVIAPVAWTDEFVAWRRRMAPLPQDRSVLCDGIPVTHPRYFFTPKVLRCWYGSFFRSSVRPAFGRAVAEFRPEVVLASWAYPDGLAAAELGQRAGLPVVINVVGSDVLLARGAGRRGMIEAVRRADGVAAVSGHLAREVAARGVHPAKIRVIYNGVDVQQFHAGDREEARHRLGWRGVVPRILFVGNLVHVKGLDVLIDALIHLKQADDQFECYLIGQGPLRGALEERAACGGVADRVRFVGPVPHEELPTWYRAADLLVLPSRSEGVPNVLLEASACGLRYIATRVGGIPEIGGFGDGVLVAPGSVEELRTAIVTRLRSPRTLPTTDGHCVRDFADTAHDLAQFLMEVRQRRLARSAGAPRAPGVVRAAATP